jgi:hypothetical protein
MRQVPVVSVVEEIQRLTESVETSQAPFEGYQELRAWFLRMKAEGLVKKQVYNLPLMDTAGRGLYKRR